MNKKAIAAASVLAVAGLITATVTTSSDSTTTTAATTTTNKLVYMGDAVPSPLPPFGARVVLKGCAQKVGVTVHVPTKGVVIQSSEADHWVTKSVNNTPNVLNPPVLKGPMKPDVWILFSKFSDPQKFTIYYASKICPGTTNLYKWNASQVTVTVIP